ncbi:hypothetical protein CENSYa_1237 [Cenarchaeum symbiosum A]|uniref:Apea-like HEPN domain-containing protein n=1 Tax=Cenarchaeum symbiosum (strain A) TaxID=414004 RepID=A0RWZ3_CENSY|nr:hypothetical protein CENSYa_1237 [Cenarchaeum symbiosum A]
MLCKNIDEDHLRNYIFVHKLVNPSITMNSMQNVLEISNQKYIFLEKKLPGSRRTRYELTITEPDSLGRLNYKENIDKEFWSDVILSINLVAKNVVVRDYEINPQHLNVQNKHESISIIQKINKMIHISTTDKLPFSDSVSIDLSTPEKIIEDEIYYILKLISEFRLKYYTFETTCSKLKLYNIKYSLDRYYSAMHGNDRISIFRDLYNSLELAMGYDEKNPRGERYDNKVFDKINTNKKDVESWRNLNNELKHGNNVSHPTICNDGTIAQKIENLRLAAQAGISYALTNFKNVS